MDTVKSAKDLVTKRPDVVSGFRWQAEEKARRAGTYKAIAVHFRTVAPSIKTSQALWADDQVFQFALGACALSAKACNQLGNDLCKEIVTEAIAIDQLSDPAYVEDLVSRYMLTCGDALGGTMRNVIGQKAQNILSEYVFNYLHENGVDPVVKRSKANKITEIQWKKRTLVFDRKPVFIGKNIDIILLDATTFDKKYLEMPARIVACGELKGGIDPAGADEHWKTAKTALERVKTAFDAKNAQKPALFFIGAAIEASMATEIFQNLQVGFLNAAANSHHSEQMSELTKILTDL